MCFGYILVYFHRLCAGVVAIDMMRDLSSGGVLTGLLGAAYFYPYALMQVPAGLLSDSIGPRKTITFFFLIAALGSFIIGISANIASAVAGRLLVGIGVAMLFVPTMKILSSWFKPDDYPVMAGILVAMGGVGSLSATSPLAYLSSATSWRFSFILIAFLTLLLTVLIWLIVRDSPVNNKGAAVKNGINANELKAAMKKVFTTPAFWALSVWFFFDCAVFFSFGGLWGVPYLMNIYKLSKIQAGNIISMLAIGMIAGSPLLGFLSNKVVKGRKIIVVVCSVITVFLTASLWIFPDKFSINMLYLICLGLGISTNAVVSVSFTATKELFPNKIAGTAIGLINFFPFAGGALFQQILGFILEYHGRINGEFRLEGFRSAFLLLFLASIIAFISSLFIRETFKKY